MTEDKKQPSNEALAVMIHSLRELLEERFRANDSYHVRHGKRLDRLNGQVSKNTTHRVQGKLVRGILGVLGVGVVGLFIDKLFM